MYSKRLLLIGSCSLLLGIAICAFIFHIEQKDYALFKKIAEEAVSPPLHKSFSSSSQTRKGITKNIRYQGKDSHFFHMKSDSSQLHFLNHQGKIELKEDFEKVDCLMQQELFYLLPDGREVVKDASGRLILRDSDPHEEDSWISSSFPGLIPMQTVYFLKAKLAHYTYVSQVFEARDVELWKYRLEGHDATFSPGEKALLCMHATADRTLIHLDEAAPTFQAEGLRGNVYDRSQNIYLQAHSVEYDGEIILLSQEVLVENSMGKITAEMATLKRDHEGKTKMDFPWVELTGKVIVTLSQGGLLTCEHIFLDYTQMHANLTGKPYIIYTELGKKVFAAKSCIDYLEEKGKIQLAKMTLIDNVQMENLGSQEDPAEQYALADLVTYFPKENLMIFEGNTNRVLFFDTMRKIELSALAIHAVRDSETNKERIQGKGDVRFLFCMEEQEKLRELFKWKKS